MVLYIAPAVDLADNTDLYCLVVYLGIQAPEYTDGEMTSTGDTSGQFNLDELLLLESHFYYI